MHLKSKQGKFHYSHVSLIQKFVIQIPTVHLTQDVERLQCTVGIQIQWGSV